MVPAWPTRRDRVPRSVSRTGPRPSGLGAMGGVPSTELGRAELPNNRRCSAIAAVGKLLGVRWYALVQTSYNGIKACILTAAPSQTALRKLRHMGETQL